MSIPKGPKAHFLEAEASNALEERKLQMTDPTLEIFSDYA